jgi:hypothetical protein
MQMYNVCHTHQHGDCVKLMDALRLRPSSVINLAVSLGGGGADFCPNTLHMGIILQSCEEIDLFLFTSKIHLNIVNCNRCACFQLKQSGGKRMSRTS